jgi:hypothetical protein
MNLDLRIAKLVARAFEQAGSWHALQQQIAQATGSDDFTVDRRKLKKLCSDDAASTPLTIKELKALQIFFSNREFIDIRDNMLFSLPKMLLDGFANETSVTILLPTRFSDKANVEMSSRWDLRAVDELVSTPEPRGVRPFRLYDVFHYGPEIRGKKLREAYQSEEWYRIINDTKAVISIGSPFGNYATELLLCEMAGVETPFEPVADSANLPFRFFWESKNYMSNSAFALRDKPDSNLLGRGCHDHDDVDRGLLVGDKWYPAHRNGDSTNLVVAQFKNGRLRIVLSGIYAPATLGLAKQLADNHIPLLISEKQNHLLVATVVSSIDQSPGGGNLIGTGIKRDWRELKAIRFENVRIWNTETRGWE